MTIICAEIGINHNGNLKTAFELMHMAKICGADYVKFQMKTPELCTPEGDWNKPKETPWGTIEPYIEYRRKMEFDDNQYLEIDNYSKQINMPWFVSVWDRVGLKRAVTFNLPFIKIPSAAVTDLTLVRLVAETKIPIVASTGMSTMGEVQLMVNTIRQYRGKLSYILYCHAAYPAPDDELDFRVMEHLGMRYFYMFTEPGFSSHSVSPFPAIYSVAWGAKFVEAHITLDRAQKGTDHAASLEAAGLSLIVRESKRIQLLRKDGVKRIHPGEELSRARLRRT